MIVLMGYIVISIILGVIGLILGSFSGATVWRIRARQLAEDKASGEEVDANEYKTLVPLTKTTLKSDRSRCLHCGHTLAWYDLLPLVSWLRTGGKCQYCKAPIGRFEPLIELGLAVFFVGSYLLWPNALQSPLMIINFILWLVAGVMLAILFAYDFKWFLLPNVVVFPLIGIGAVFALLHIVGAPDMMARIISLFGSIIILSGIYFGLWLVSKGQWIGYGDVKLGFALALLVGDWRLAFLALFAANLIGCLLVIPGMLAGKITRTTRVPFGPLFIVGTVIAVLAGPAILTWYMHALIFS